MNEAKWSNPVERIRRVCARDHEAPLADVIVLSISEGYGRHTHDASCRKLCLRHCDDSDLIVELQYNRKGNQAVYGLLDDDISLWMN